MSLAIVPFWCGGFVHVVGGGGGGVAPCSGEVRRNGSGSMSSLPSPGRLAFGLQPLLVHPDFATRSKGSCLHGCVLATLGAELGRCRVLLRFLAVGRR